jgi:hypothetical protein
VNVPPAFFVITTWSTVSGGAAVVGIVVVNAPLNAPPAERLALRLLVDVPVAPAPGKVAAGRAPNAYVNEADANVAAAAEASSARVPASASMAEPAT